MASVKALYQVTDDLFFGVETAWKSFQAKKGNNRTYALVERDDDNDRIPAIFNQPFNVAKWNSFSALFVLKYLF